MQQTKLIKVYHQFDKGRKYQEEFFDGVSQTLEHQKMTFGVNYLGGEIFYSLTADESTHAAFEGQFYSTFNDFQIVEDTKDTLNYNNNDNTIVGELVLENSWFYPFKYSHTDNTDFIKKIFRNFENLDLLNDKAGFFIEMTPLLEESFIFYIKSKIHYLLFRGKLFFTFFKYIFNHKIQGGWKKLGKKYFDYKLEKELFQVKIFFVVQSESKAIAKGKIQALFNNFLVFKNYPLNQFGLKFRNYNEWGKGLGGSYTMTSEEISSFFHFPADSKDETSLLKVTAKKLALPIGVPVIGKTQENSKHPFQKLNIIGKSDYRSTQVPVGIYDEDRLRHVYVVGKTGTGKSKFLTSLIIDDLKKGKGIGLIDPHGDLIEDIIDHIPESRKNDVIIFDPLDSDFPFCINPLDVGKDESKQVLAKGFIDIFKKFFGTNWNPKLEHVLRMVFLALLDKEGATLFDVVRALTDKDFRYDMIEEIEDDVIRNFWTNEFAGWSQQFNSEAIMPILNKIGQLLSIDVLKNIFSSKENKLDFRKAMDESKIILIKLPKGKLQEEVMGFLGAMFVTKMFQAAMSRQGLPKEERVPFFLYVDEFQNFATDTFGEILSEARKYGLSLSVAHQYIKQIPEKLSDALFGNIGTLVSFRISSEDALYMEKHFDPFIGSYDLANLNIREFYCKLLVKGQVKDPFSLRSLYVEDPKTNPKYIEELYKLSRKQYARSLQEAQKNVIEDQKDVIKKVEGFVEPII